MKFSSTKRLIFATTGLMGVLITLNAAHFSAASKAGVAAGAAASREIPHLQALQDMRFGALRIVSSATEYVLLALTKGDNAEAVAAEKRLSERGGALYAEAMRRYAEHRPAAKAEASDRFLAKVSAAYGNLTKTAGEFTAAADRGLDTEEIGEIKEVFEAREQAIMGLIDTHLTNETGRAEVDLQAVVEEIASAQHFALTITVIALASFLLYGIFVFSLIRKLAAARDRAEVANRAKSAFLSGMSHELRTPMNAVLGFAQVLEGDPAAPLTAKQDRCVRYIVEKGNELVSLVDNILLFADIQDGAIPVTLERVTLGPMIRECLDITRGDAENRGVALIDALSDADLPEIDVDQAHFKVALRILLSNAVDYNRDGGDATVGAEARPDGWLRIAVADTGQGIADDKQRQLFQLFHRLDIVHSKVGGSGIGLSIAKKLTEAMGGRIGFESEAGRGSTFWLEFPAAGQVNRSAD